MRESVGSRTITILESARPDRLKPLLDLAREKRVPIHRVPRFDLDRSLGDVRHQGVVARIAAARYGDADGLLDLLGSKVGSLDPPLALELDGIEDPHNLGSIVRTAECAGAHGVFIAERRAVGLTSVVAKVAAGALEYVPVARVTNLVRLIEQLKERNIWVIGAAAEAKQMYGSGIGNSRPQFSLVVKATVSPAGSRTLRHVGAYSFSRADWNR